jgi:hypothetical protein
MMAALLCCGLRMHTWKTALDLVFAALHTKKDAETISEMLEFPRGRIDELLERMEKLPPRRATQWDIQGVRWASIDAMRILL